MKNNELMGDVTVIVPVYNEKEVIAVTFTELRRECRQIKIIVVDDNSRDGTRELVQALHEQYHNVFLVERPGLMGIGGALFIYV